MPPKSVFMFPSFALLLIPACESPDFRRLVFSLPGAPPPWANPARYRPAKVLTFAGRYQTNHPGSGQGAEVAPQPVGIGSAQQPPDPGLGPLPEGNGRREQRPA